MRSKSTLARWGVLLVLCALALYGPIKMVRERGTGMDRFLSDALKSLPFWPEGLLHSNASSVAGVDYAFPSSTHLCIGGCKEHQNWIVFYLASNSYVRSSLRLKTRLFFAQILTYGISATPCPHQDKPGYTCVEMELSHRLLWFLTQFNLTPLNQLRDTNNWWLEYTPLP